MEGRKTVLNSSSKRQIIVGGKRYNELIKEGYTIDDNGILNKPNGEEQVTPVIITPKRITPVTPKRIIPSTPKRITPLITTLKQMAPSIIPSIPKRSPIYENPLMSILKSSSNITEQIISQSSPNDLLTLYLTDKDFQKILDDTKTTNLLSYKFNTPISTGFLQFIKNYNTQLVQNDKTKRLYLYNLENTLHDPNSGKAYTGTFTLRNRTNLINWLYQLPNLLKISDYAFCLTITLFDIYVSLGNIDRINVQGIACMCMSIAADVTDESIPAIYEYVRMTDDSYTSQELRSFKLDIISKLDGIIIRPSVVFFTDMANPNIRNLTILSYFAYELTNYKPSLVAETINYIVTGQYKIYTLMEIAGPCKILTTLIDVLAESSLEIKQLAISLREIIKHKCIEEISNLNQPAIAKHNEWHIGEYEKVCIIGSGVGGNVYKIRSLKHNAYYVLKSILNNTDAAVREISTLRLLSCSPYIIKLHEIEVHKDPISVNLYLDSGLFDLKKGINDGLLNKNNTNTYLKQITLAVDYCHQHDIIHRDIKEDNIIFDGHKLVLIDFGLSVTYASTRKYLDPSLAATPLYRAPEAILGDTHYNYKIDIWALGIVFGAILTGENILVDVNELNDLPIENFLDILLISIFEIFGTPTEKTWPGVTELYGWDKYSKYEYPENIDELKERLGVYYDFIAMCLVLNPSLRADTQILLKYLDNIK